MDRFLTLYLCSPVARLMGWNHRPHVPILMYHSISTNLFGLSHPYSQINTAPEMFSMQMRWLRNAGYQSVTLSELVDGFADGQEMSKKVVITFDDGYRDLFTDGLAILKQCRFTATIFLATDRIRDTPMRFEGVDYLTWRDVRELQKEGMNFGSHTVTHPDLRSLELEQIDYELGYSKEVIEQKLGVAVESFSYPFPFPEEDHDFIRFLGDTLQNQGFRNGVSNIIGRAHRESNPYFLPRLGVNSWDRAELLEAKVQGGYDWMHWPQLVKKRVLHNATLMQPGRKAGAMKTTV
ncbi:MAG: polysaccharide deacetylase family protein [Candidatus Acidiferrum sp.]